MCGCEWLRESREIVRLPEGMRDQFDTHSPFARLYAGDGPMLAAARGEIRGCGGNIEALPVSWREINGRIRIECKSR